MKSVMRKVGIPDITRFHGTEVAKYAYIASFMQERDNPGKKRLWSEDLETKPCRYRNWRKKNAKLMKTAFSTFKTRF